MVSSCLNVLENNRMGIGDQIYVRFESVWWELTLSFMAQFAESL